MATNYPGSLDSLPRPTSSTPMDASGFEGDVVIDNLSDAIEAIEGELGTDPAGGAATVAARQALIGRASDMGGMLVWPSGEVASTLFLSSLASDTGTIGANTIWYVPYFSTYPVTLDRITISVIAAVASAHARVGVYSAGADMGPNSLLLDAGEVDCSTTGAKELTISQALTGDTLYWFAILSELAGTGFRAQGSYSRAIGLVDGTGTWTGRTVLCQNSVTYSSGLPGTAPSLASVNLGSYSKPVFWLRRT